MHAVIVTATIEPDRAQEAQAQLEANVLPRVKETPGLVAGYWTRSGDGQRGLSLVLFESEQAARAAAELPRSMPPPDFVTIDSVEVREVIAQV